MVCVNGKFSTVQIGLEVLDTSYNGEGVTFRDTSFSQREVTCVCYMQLPPLSRFGPVQEPYQVQHRLHQHTSQMVT